MDKSLERLVWQRVGGLCEYCLMPQEYDIAVFEIDHIISQKHDGPTAAGNPALSCFYCNSFKGRHSWTRHFRWQGAYLIGRTSIGRVTIAVLKINDPLRLRLREGLIDEGVFPR
jgi:hypothetical protein